MTANALLSLGLTNALFATLLALCGWLLTRFWRNPHVAAVVWLVVLLKLVTPPLITLPIEFIGDATLREGEVPAEPREFLSDAISSARESDRRAVGVGPPVAPSPEQTTGLGFTAGREAIVNTSNDAVVSRPVSVEVSREPDKAFVGAPSVPISDVPQEEVEPASTSLTTYLPQALLTLWVIGAFTMACVTTVRIVRFRRCLRQAAIASDDVRREANRVAQRLGLRRCPRVCVIDANVGPMVWAGGVKPLIVVPRPLWETLEPSARETLLAHELAHVVRRDPWVRRLEAIVLGIYWWLPTAWLAVRRRETAAETCCDAWVLSTYPDRPRDYAEALFHAVSVMSTGRPLVLASGLGRTTELKERLAMIAHDRVPVRPSRLTRYGLAVIALGALLLSARFVQADPADEKSAADDVKTAAPATEQGASPATEPPAAVENGPAVDPAAVEPEPTLDELLPDEGTYRGSYGPTSAASRRPAGGRGAAGASRGGAAAGSRGGAAGASRGGMPMSGMSSRGGGMPMSGMSARGMPSFGGMEGYGPAAAHGGGRSVRRSVRPPEETIAKMLAGLREVLESPQEPAEVKIQALRSYGRLARGTAEQKAAEDVLLSAARNAKDDRTKLGAADALHTLGSPKGVELMWTLFAKSKDVNTRATSLRVLDQAEAVPPTVESIRQLVTSTSDDGNPFVGGMPGMMGGGGFPPNYPQGILRRLTDSGDGLRRLVKAAESFPADEAAGMGAMLPGGESDGSGGFGSEGSGMAMGAMGGGYPPRAVLLGTLRGAVPENEDISAALVGALSSKDPGVRAAAAQALGNVSELPVETNGEDDPVGKH
ncbi:MAG: M56 family metallopeptidase [Planctomycetota bacterium]|nr:M56 family metallopeptidase [Planctomycetota bacterium]